MTQQRCSGIGRDAMEFECLLEANGRVDEKHRRRPTQIQRMLDLQLILGKQLQAWWQRLFDARRQLRAERVVATGIIADREHDQPIDRAQSRTTRSMTSPSAAASSTINGIRPSAWVAHDRHGSKARMATSM